MSLDPHTFKCTENIETDNVSVSCDTVLSILNENTYLRMEWQPVVIFELFNCSVHADSIHL